MDEVVNIGVREMACPGCGYDLRATGVVEGGRRCPECGKVWRGGLLTRVPWARRGELGLVRAYVRTMGMVMWRPKVLAQEPWIRERDARVFHRISLLLATVVGTGLLMGTFFLRGYKWSGDLVAQVPTAEDSGAMWHAQFPVYVLADSAWVVVPLGIAVYLSVGLSMWVYRGFLRMLSGDGSHRRRVLRMGLYATGIVPVTLMFLGAAAMGGMVLYEEHTWLGGNAEVAWGVVVGLMGVLGVLAFYVPTMRLVVNTGRWKILRVVAMLPVFYYVAVLIWMGVGVLVFWAVGYAVIAAASMVR